ncbi:IS3-like element ISAba45 family transposase [Acinetobacter baumannii]|nr:IS3-like element ISAba45 family transposase [Acinetobacter baumannii]AUT38581.1 IS3 family transposase [Acinetobacter baumannii]
MAKYSQEFKLEVVQYYLSGFGRHQVSHKFGIHHSDVAKWVANYNNHGAEGLSRKNTNTVYTPEFKFKVIQSVLEQGLSVREATNQFNLKSHTQLLSWLLQYKEHGIDGLKAKPKGRPKSVPKPKIKKVKNALNDRDKTQEQLLEELAYLRAENAYLKKRRALNSEAERTGTSRTATVTRFISELRQNYKLKYLLRASQMARSTYFYHEQRSKLNDKYSDLKQQIKMIYHKHKGRYGYRRITLALKNMGLTINHKCVQRLMQSMKLKSRIRIAKYRSYKGDIGQVADNVLQRQFKADKPNQKWVTDVTEFNIRGDRLYLSPIMDLFNGEIIAFQTHRRPMYELVKNMLKDALTKLADHEKPIIHSDQGWQYQMRHYQRELAENGLTQSMSRKGNCLDNASMESFFGILKSECFYGEKFNSVEELEKTVKEYIHYYNHERIKVKL